MHTKVFHSLDFDRDGKALSYLGVPFSIDRSPYHQMKVPVCVVRNGEGPSVLLMAGNHGDEYEGELSLARLIRKIDPARIRGRVTIMPMTNAAAVMAAKRTSPLDGGNLNRAFPGSAEGGATSRLAYFLEHTLIPAHDVVFDIHSGGTTMAHVLCALMEKLDDAERQERTWALLRQLGLDYAFVVDNGPLAPTSLGAARRAGVIGRSGEFGGGGTTTPQSMNATARAIDNLLLALGIITEPVLGSVGGDSRPMQLLDWSRADQAIYATHRGWFEPAVGVGDTVAAGDIAGWLHDLERVELAETELRFAEGGVVLCYRLPTMCESGDCLALVAAPTA